MSKLTIKGAFHDEISRILHHNDTTTPSFMNTTTIDVENGASKEKMAEMFSTCLSYQIIPECDEYGTDGDGYIEFTVKRPQADIDKFHEDRKHSLKCSISRLKKWYDREDRPEDREQIKTYLIAKELNWILEAIEA